RPRLVRCTSARGLTLADVVFTSGDDQDQRVADTVRVAVLQLLVGVRAVRRAVRRTFQRGRVADLAAGPGPDQLLRLGSAAATRAAGDAARATLHRTGLEAAVVGERRVRQEAVAGIARAAHVGDLALS